MTSNAFVSVTRLLLKTYSFNLRDYLTTEGTKCLIDMLKFATALMSLDRVYNVYVHAL